MVRRALNGDAYTATVKIDGQPLTIALRKVVKSNVDGRRAYDPRRYDRHDVYDS